MSRGEITQVNWEPATEEEQDCNRETHVAQDHRSKGGGKHDPIVRTADWESKRFWRRRRISVLPATLAKPPGRAYKAVVSWLTVTTTQMYPSARWNSPRDPIMI